MWKDLFFKSILFAGEVYIIFTVMFSLLYNVNKFMEFTTVYQEVQVNETTRL